MIVKLALENVAMEACPIKLLSGRISCDYDKAKQVVKDASMYLLRANVSLTDELCDRNSSVIRHAVEFAERKYDRRKN